MIFGCPIVGSRLLRDRFGDPWSLAQPFGMPSIAVRPSFVTPSNDAGVETAVIFSFVSACPYTSPLFD
jgi:hypothetical protein